MAPFLAVIALIASGAEAERLVDAFREQRDVVLDASRP
jgi:hypothetical protein